jgi:hypothetical protein
LKGLVLTNQIFVMQEKFQKANLRFGHTSAETALLVSDYPYGFSLRCSIRYWIETKKGKGMRFCSQTTNPKKKGEPWNKPHCSTYNKFAVLYIEPETGHVKWTALNPYERKNFPAQMDWLINEVGIENVPIEVQNLIREWYVYDIAISFGFRKSKFASEESQKLFTEWSKATIDHIKKAEFADICKHDPEPMPETENAG